MTWLLLALLSAPALAQEGSEQTEQASPAELPIVQGPQITEYVEAPYPTEAQEQGLEGTVVLLVEIDAEGTVLSVEVTGPAGHGFDEAALEAVQAMRFSPALTEAGPVPVAFEFAYGFTFEPEVPVEEAPPPINLEGRVREMGTRAPVQGAKVVVRGLDIVGETDAEGRFQIRGVPQGAHEVWIQKPGYVRGETDLEIAEGEITAAELWVRSESYRDNESVAVYHRVKEEVTRRTITIEEVKRVPGTFGDPIKVVQTLPGAARTPFGTGLLVIRGSNPEDSGVYIDGIRVPIIYHLTGTTSVISPELVEAVDYLPGGYGVQYGRSQGGVVEVRTRTDFEDTKLTWGTDILDSQLYYQGKVGKDKKHGLAIGARRSYIDLFLPWFVRSDFVIKPWYWDYQLKWVPELEGSHELSVFVYGYKDVLTVSSPDDRAQGPDADTQGDLGTTYLAHRAILSYTNQLSDQTELRITPSVGYDGGDFGLGEEFEGRSDNLLIWGRAEVEWAPSEAIHVVPGLDLAYTPSWKYELRLPFSPTDFEDPFSDREPFALDDRGTAINPDVYLKLELRPLADRDRLLIIPGVRYNWIRYTADSDSSQFSQSALGPRLQARFAPSAALTLKGGTGIYNQLPLPSESVGPGGAPSVDFEYAWAHSLGFEHQVTQAIRWDAEVFYKDMRDQIVFNSAYDLYAEDSELWTNQGVGRAYGLELIARHDKADRFFGWISYTLSKAERRDYPDSDWYPFSFDQTHILSAQAGYDLPYDLGLSAQVQYVTGNPDSKYDSAVYDADFDFYSGFRVGPYNGERLPPYFQTSLRVDKLWTFKRWQFDTYLDLINLIRGVNPELTVYSYDYSDWAYVRGIPTIPNVGIEARFYL